MAQARRFDVSCSAQPLGPRLGIHPPLFLTLTRAAHNPLVLGISWLPTSDVVARGNAVDSRRSQDRAVSVRGSVRWPAAA